MNTSIQRLTAIKHALDSNKFHKENFKHWCQAKICGCMGCASSTAANLGLGGISKQEWNDYNSWEKSGYPEKTNESGA